MIKNYENKIIDVRLNKDLRGMKAGTTIGIKTDKHGTPLERYWRDRMKDAPIDNCIEVVKVKKKTKGKKEE